MKALLLAALGLVRPITSTIRSSAKFGRDYVALTNPQYLELWTRLQDLLQSEDAGSDFLALNLLLPTAWARRVAMAEQVHIPQITDSSSGSWAGILVATAMHGTLGSNRAESSRPNNRVDDTMSGSAHVGSSRPVGSSPNLAGPSGPHTDATVYVSSDSEDEGDDGVNAATQPSVSAQSPFGKSNRVQLQTPQTPLDDGLKHRRLRTYIAAPSGSARPGSSHDPAPELHESGLGSSQSPLNPSRPPKRAANYVLSGDKYEGNTGTNALTTSSSSQKPQPPPANRLKRPRLRIYNNSG